MKRTLAPILLLILLLPSLALGKIETSINLGKRDGLFYQKFFEEPFTDDITGGERGRFVPGKKEDGIWIEYHDNGHLSSKGYYKNSYAIGTWVTYHKNHLDSVHICSAVSCAPVTSSRQGIIQSTYKSTC